MALVICSCSESHRFASPATIHRVEAVALAAGASEAEEIPFSSETHNVVGLVFCLLPYIDSSPKQPIICRVSKETFVTIGS